MFYMNKQNLIEKLICQKTKLQRLIKKFWYG